MDAEVNYNSTGTAILFLENICGKYNRPGPECEEKNKMGVFLTSSTSAQGLNKTLNCANSTIEEASAERTSSFYSSGTHQRGD